MNDKSARDTLPTGFELHWFVLESILGRGGYGVTYLAVDKNLDRKVAIKEYFPMDFASRLGDQTVAPRGNEQEEMYQWGLERFLKEARTLAKFNHPNIVRVISVFEQNGTAYMVMEYEQGENLSTVFKRKPFFSEEELLDIFIPVIDGLSLVHQAGFIHRDIKPSNIYIREDNSPVLIDFGSARQSSGQTRTLTSLVTYGYAPFEQYNEGNEKQGPWTDIYSLGATMYFGIVKQKPEDAMRRGGSILSKTSDPYRPVFLLMKGKYSDNFLLTIDNALQFRAEDRPQDAITWAQMLLGNIKAPPLPAEFLSDQSDGSDKTLIVGQSPRERAMTGDRSKPHTGRLIDASGRRVTGSSATGEYSGEPFPKQMQGNKPNKRSGKTIAVAVIGLLAALGIVAILLPSLWKKPYQQITKIVQVPPQQQAKQANTGSQQTAEQQGQTKQITALLVEADQRYVSGQLVEPEGDSAAALYQQVLQKDPANKHALDGIKKIARYYHDAASRALLRGDLTYAQKQLSYLQLVAPDSPETRAILQRLNASQDKQKTVARLLRQAEQAYNKRWLMAPEGKNALALYNEVLKYDPDNKDVKRGIDKIFNYYKDSAESALKNDNTDKVESILGKMEVIKPGSPEAHSLRQQIKHVSSKNKQINNLLDLAGRAYNTGKYIEPSSGSAFHYYKEVLKLDPANSSAKSGINAIKQFYTRQFDHYLNQNQLDMARQMANSLKVVETNPAVLSKVFKALRKRSQPQKPDIEMINSLIGKFKSAIESSNVKQIKAISEFSPGREQFVKQFYANYKSVNVSVSGFEFIPREHKGKASINLINLINNHNQPVQAGAWGRFNIVVQQNNDGDWRIFW